MKNLYKDVACKPCFKQAFSKRQVESSHRSKKPCRLHPGYNAASRTSYSFCPLPGLGAFTVFPSNFPIQIPIAVPISHIPWAVQTDAHVRRQRPLWSAPG